MSDTNILGDNVRRNRFNKNLADIVNKDVEVRLNKEAEKESRKKSKKVISPKIVEPTTPHFFNMDMGSAESGASMIYDSWIRYWNGVSDGRVMASMADYYATFKAIKSTMLNGSSEEKKKAELLWSSIKMDLRESIMTSTTLRYMPDTKSVFVNHYKNLDKAPTTWSKAEFYEAKCEPIEHSLHIFRKIDYLQKCFDTGDHADAIVDTLEYIVGVKDIRIWSELQDFSAINNYENTMFMAYNHDDFNIRFEIGFDKNNVSHSRGFLYSEKNK